MFWSSFHPQHLPILMYHQIFPRQHPHFSHHIAIASEDLKTQLIQLKEAGWQFITLNQTHFPFEEPPLYSSEHHGKSLVLTFDDLASSFIDYAQPILKELNIRATLFPIHNMYRNKPYLNLSAKGLRPVTEDELKQLYFEGHELGSHGQSHQSFRSLPISEVCQELKESKQWLEELSGHAVTSLCYPIGGVDLDIIDAAKNLGYQRAVTILKGTLQNSQDQMRLRRVNMKHPLTGLALRYTLSPLYGLRRYLTQPLRSKYKINYRHSVVK